MRRLVFASSNAGKVSELQALLGHDWQVLSAKDFPNIPEVIEDAETFEGNAAKKARAFVTADWVLRSWIGILVMLGTLWALFYHLLAGLRHLYYDSGRGMEIDTGRTLSIAVLAGSAVLTLLTLILLA